MNQAPFVDLTSSSPPGEPRLSGSTGQSSSWGPEESSQSSLVQHSFKRRRLNNGSAAGLSLPPTSESSSLPRNQQPDLNEVEAVDLTEHLGPPQLLKTVAKQQEDAVRAQQPNLEPSRSTLTAYKCPVCMDTPENATTTICGHLFCHKCIVDTIRFGERRPYESSTKTLRGNCPVCRKPLTRVDTPGPRRNLVPLQLKLKTRSRQ
ncbi:hypothetical protein VTO42DRAFT_7827 [Malbranchea cinnamomea]